MDLSQSFYFADWLVLFSVYSTYEQHHYMIFNILWEMVLSSNIRMKTDAANVLKVIVRASFN